jgi:large subunit ribosomal protein L24
MPKPIIPSKCHIRTGDKVVLITGPKDRRGKTGTVIKIFVERQRALVEGECSAHDTRHVKPNPQTKQEGGRLQRLRPIHISNLALLDPTTGKAAARVRHEKDAQGNTIRVAKKSGHRFLPAGKV